MINRVNPAMIAYRNMPKKRSDYTPNKKSMGLLQRDMSSDNNMSEDIKDGAVRMRNMMDHINKLKEEI